MRLGEKRFSLGELFARLKNLMKKHKHHERPESSTACETFTRTIRLCRSPQYSMAFKGILDGGCAVGDLISEEVVSGLNSWSEVEFDHKVIGTCLNGDDIHSIGTLVLRVDGEGLCKILDIKFYVVPGDSLPWQVVLGASTCAKHHLLKVGAYGGREVPSKECKAEKAKRKIKMQEHKKKVAANDGEVKQHKKKNCDGAQQNSSSSGGS